MEALQISNDFFGELVEIAPQIGQGTFAFHNSEGEAFGFVQLIAESDRIFKVHRIWTPQPRRGHGSRMLTSVCMLADRHAVTLKLKALPLGAKPYPFSSR